MGSSCYQTTWLRLHGKTQKEEEAKSVGLTVLRLSLSKLAGGFSRCFLQSLLPPVNESKTYIRAGLLQLKKHPRLPEPLENAL